MASIIINEERHPVASGATVLDTLLAVGLDVPHGCRVGICQSCLVRASDGEIPTEAQEGLKDGLTADGWFLACRCAPAGELTVDLEAATPPPVQARVVRKRLLAPGVMGIWLEAAEPLDYRAGQYVTVWRDDAVGRCYSLASLPEEPELELHVARVDGGVLSAWLHDSIAPGDSLELRGPIGDCRYAADDPEQPLVLVGTGTGLSPMYGVARDALRRGHTGPIHLFHGARTPELLYYRETLADLSEKAGNFHYHPSILDPADDPLPPGAETGAIGQLLQRELPSLEGWRVFLSGAPAMVNHLRKQCFLAGAASHAIHADPFA